MAKPKQISGIDCDAASAAGMRRVVAVRLEEMCALRERALDETDPEGVHDMRVASRRLRSALRDFMPFARKRRIAKSLKEIKAVADALGVARDQDVAIPALDKLAGKAPPEVSPGIKQLAEIRRAKRIEASARLVPILDEACLTQLQSEFVPALEAATKPARKKSRPSAHSAADLTYREVARVTILDRLNELEKLSDSLYHPLKVKPLHKMRIAAKRLRYALELFEMCWGKQLGLFANRIASLQSSLGELHDCDVWIVEFGENLSRRRNRAGGNNPDDSDREAASIWLLDHFVKQRTKHLRSALGRWREWETNNYSEKLRRIVQSASATPLIAACPSSRAASKATASPRAAPVSKPAR